MTDSFWAGGADAHAKVIRKHYEPLLKNLHRQRDNAKGPERDALSAEIERTKAEYKSKLNSIDNSLF